MVTYLSKCMRWVAFLLVACILVTTSSPATPEAAKKKNKSTHKCVADMCGPVIGSSYYDRGDGTHNRCDSYYDLCSTCKKEVGGVKSIKTVEEHDYGTGREGKCICGASQPVHVHQPMTAALVTVEYIDIGGGKHFERRVFVSICSCGGQASGQWVEDYEQPHEFCDGRCNKCHHVCMMEEKVLSETVYSDERGHYFSREIVPTSLCCGLSFGGYCSVTPVEEHSYTTIFAEQHPHILTYQCVECGFGYCDVLITEFRADCEECQAEVAPPIVCEEESCVGEVVVEEESVNEKAVVTEKKEKTKEKVKETTEEIIDLFMVEPVTEKLTQKVVGEVVAEIWTGEATLENTVKQVVESNTYAGETTTTGLVAGVLFGFTELDLLVEINNIKYDLVNFKSESKENGLGWHILQTSLDMISFFPYLGFAKKLDDLLPAVSKVAKESADEIAEMANDLTKKLVKNADEGAVGIKTVVKSNAEKLNWDTVVKKGETREMHVALHEVNDLGKPEHGIFYGDAVDTINKAWSNRASGYMMTAGNVDLYIVPYRNAGYAGGYLGQGNNLNHVTIVTQKGTNNIITGFPGSGYKYTVDDLIGGE